LNRVEKARISDVAQMHKLINYFASKDKMLARSLSEIYENIRDYFVVREGEQVVACAALHVHWADLAEVKSLAVAENSQEQGIGTQLKLGFSQVEKGELPHKIWAECLRCPKFPNCDEVALICHFEVPASG